MLSKSIRRTISSNVSAILLLDSFSIVKLNCREFRQFYKKMGDLGLLGVTANPEYGGTGLSYLDHCIVMEELSRYSMKPLTLTLRNH